MQGSRYTISVLLGLINGTSLGQSSFEEGDSVGFLGLPIRSMLGLWVGLAWVLCGLCCLEARGSGMQFGLTALVGLHLQAE